MTWLKNHLRDKFLAGALAAVPVVVVEVHQPLRQIRSEKARCDVESRTQVHSLREPGARRACLSFQSTFP
jgi:hypothetical protein